MNVDKFKTLVDSFSPSLLSETFQRSHDFFRVKQNLLPIFNDKQFTEFRQLGDFELDDSTSVIVVCARSLAHLNERASRKTQYDISKKILKNFQKYRAGIFIYYDSKGDFRISLVYADYAGTKVNYSTFRRFTYFVSKEQTNTTFFQQVAPFDFTNFQALKEIFSVEKVTKEFFKKYRDLFIETLEDFNNNREFQGVVVGVNISTTADFVKKLMGQIVFLYFVQKKGWLGVRPNEKWGTGNQAYLRFLFEGCVKANKNYFNDYLEPLFYKALAEKNKDDYFELFNCRIPFLNGGLFESIYDWENTKIIIPNKTLEKLLDFFDQYNFTVDENTPSDQEISVDPEMLGKIFENLLDVKDRKDKGAFYTPREIVHYMCRESLIQHLVSENTAPEERIRKIFEIKDTDLSLLVENENKIEAIKKLPELKEISEKVDLSLRNVKIVDPAVGSGAFPMGMLTEISSIRYFLNTNFLHKLNLVGKELELYDIKKETLENCIYAVDIEPGAVEIAKLRFWLALIVEYESNDSNIAPPTLPNLDYKIMQGNSLLEEYEGVKLFDEKLLQQPLINAEIFDPINQTISKLRSGLLPFYIENPRWMQKGEHRDKPSEVIILENRLRDILKQNKKIEKNSTEQRDLFTVVAESKKIWDEIKNKHRLFFSESDREKKKNLRKQIDHLNWLLIESTLKEQRNDSALKKVEKLKESNIKPFFLWHLYFAEVFEENGGFDIVIGNPPYVGEKGNKEIFRPIASGNLKEFYQGKMDLYYFFFHLGINLNKNNGILAFITTNAFLTARGAKKLRNDIRNRTCIISLINFNELKIFDSANNFTIITILKKCHDNGVVSVIENKTTELGPDKIYKILQQIDLDSKYIRIKHNDLFSGEDYYIKPFIDEGAGIINKKINLGSVSIGDVFEVNAGIQTGADKVTLSHLKNLNINSETGDGIFVLTEEEVARLNFRRFIKQVLKPWYVNTDILKWSPVINHGEWLMYINRDYKDIDIELKSHLLKFKKILQERREVKNKVIEWWKLQWPRDKNIFISPKIIVCKWSKKNDFSYTEKEWYSSVNITYITRKIGNEDISLKYAIALLNSSLYYYWLYYNGKRAGDRLMLDPKPIAEIPIKKITESEQKPFIDLVDKILAITRTEDYLTNTEKQKKVKEYEGQVDQMVYKLYGLTDEEIEIVENSTKN